MDPKFSDRLYLVNNAPGKQSSKGSQSVWNNPVGGENGMKIQMSLS